MVQKDRHAHPTDSGTAAARPTLLYALGSVSMIWPICNATATPDDTHVSGKEWSRTTGVCLLIHLLQDGSCYHHLALTSAFDYDRLVGMLALRCTNDMM
jgi:hypothetical protein